MQLEQNYTLKDDCLNMCPGVNQFFYLSIDIYQGIARNPNIPWKNKKGCLSHVIQPAYSKLENMIRLLIQTSLLILPSFLFAFPSCTPRDKTKGKLFQLDEIDDQVVVDEVN